VVRDVGRVVLDKGRKRAALHASVSTLLMSHSLNALLLLPYLPSLFIFMWIWQLEIIIDKVSGKKVE
jgi:hypothetical protein